MTQATLRLDKTRDYATVHGEGAGNIAYAQDGFHFDVYGGLLEEYLTDADRTRLQSMLAQRDVLEQAKAALKSAAPEMTEEQIAKVINLDNLKKDTEVEMDLAAWGRGEKPQYNYPKVAKLIRETYHVQPRDKGHAREILAINGVIPPVAGESTMPPVAA